MEYLRELKFIFDLPWIYAGLIIIGTFMGLAVLGLIITRQFVPSKTLKSSHDVAGFTFGIIGVIYGVLLGFTVVEANNHFHEAEQNIIRESALLAELFRDAVAFSEKERLEIRKSLRDYGRAVYAEEWPSMAEQTENPHARDLYDKIWENYNKIMPSSEKESIWFKQSLEKLNDLGWERINRVFAMQHTFGAMMWTLLVTGALVTISFMCFFSADSQIAQILMTLLLSGTIAFMLFLILSLEGIYSGDVRVLATPMEKVVERFDVLMKK